ncbi:MAG: hypothetical protein A2Z98_07225, partial [Spirochaetes bacterium GWB1_27_13]
MTNKLIFVGDIVIRNKTNEKIISPAIEKIFDEHNVISCNFEAPIISEKDKPIAKAGPNIFQIPNACDIIKKSKFNLISLANNHLCDYGKNALKNTIASFSDQTIVGAGLNFNDAYQLKIITINNIRFGFLSFCEGEFGALFYENQQNKAGYAWINHHSIDNRISDAKKQVDILIVQAHCGVEEIDIPLPEWRNRYKNLIDCGADAIIAHHPHIVQGWELYKEKPIFYSLGNFYFDKENPKPTWNLGAMVSLEYEGNKLIKYEVIPVKKIDNKVDLNTDENYKFHLNKLCEMIDSKDYYDYIDETVLRLWNAYYKNYYINAVVDVGA